MIRAFRSRASRTKCSSRTELELRQANRNARFAELRLTLGWQSACVSPRDYRTGTIGRRQEFQRRSAESVVIRADQRLVLAWLGARQVAYRKARTGRACRGVRQARAGERRAREERACR